MSFLAEKVRIVSFGSEVIEHKVKVVVRSQNQRKEKFPVEGGKWEDRWVCDIRYVVTSMLTEHILMQNTLSAQPYDTEIPAEKQAYEKVKILPYSPGKEEKMFEDIIDN